MLLSKDAFVNEGDDLILQINQQARAKKECGIDVINSSIGSLYDEDGVLSVPSTTNKYINEISILDENKTYPSCQGPREYREAVMKWVFKGYYDLVKDNFETYGAYSMGGTGALFLSFRNYVDTGHTVLIPSLGWSNYEAMIEQRNAKYDYYEMFKDGESIHVPSIINKCEQYKKEGRIVILINDPCENPTGYSFSREEWVELINYFNVLAKEVPVILILDIAYIDMEKDEKSRLFFSLIDRINKNIMVLICFSASKLLGIYGYRVGALIAITRDKQDIEDFKKSIPSVIRTSWSMANKGMAASIPYILNDKQLEQEVKNNNEMLYKRGQYFYQKLKNIGLDPLPYKAGFFVTVDTHKNAREITEKLKDKNVYVVPLKKRYLRIAICSTPFKKLDILADALNECINKE